MIYFQNGQICYFSRISRQASLPSVYHGENGNQEKSGERKGIPAGSAPPPVNYNSFQSSQIQPGKNTTSGRPKLR